MVNKPTVSILNIQFTLDRSLNGKLKISKYFKLKRYRFAPRLNRAWLPGLWSKVYLTGLSVTLWLNSMYLYIKIHTRENVLRFNLFETTNRGSSIMLTLTMISYIGPQKHSEQKQNLIKWVTSNMKTSAQQRSQPLKWKQSHERKPSVNIFFLINSETWKKLTYLKYEKELVDISQKKHTNDQLFCGKILNITDHQRNSDEI